MRLQTSLQSKRSYIKKSVLYWLYLWPFVITTLFPFAVMLSTAIKPRAEVLTFPPVWLPKHIRLQNFADMWHAVGFGHALVNSALVSFTTTALCLLIAIPAAYATGRMQFRGKRMFRQFLLVTQMLSPVVLVLGSIRGSGFPAGSRGGRTGCRSPCTGPPAVRPGWAGTARAPRASRAAAGRRDGEPGSRGAWS